MLSCNVVKQAVCVLTHMKHCSGVTSCSSSGAASSSSSSDAASSSEADVEAMRSVVARSARRLNSRTK